MLRSQHRVWHRPVGRKLFSCMSSSILADFQELPLSPTAAHHHLAGIPRAEFCPDCWIPGAEQLSRLGTAIRTVTSAGKEIRLRTGLCRETRVSAPTLNLTAILLQTYDLGSESFHARPRLTLPLRLEADSERSETKENFEKSRPGQCDPNRGDEFATPQPWLMSEVSTPTPGSPWSMRAVIMGVAKAELPRTVTASS